MSKRKNSCNVEINTKFQKLNLNHQIKDMYHCDLHNHDKTICNIYDCSGFQKTITENFIKYYVK